MSAAMIALKDVSKALKGKVVLDRVTAEFAAGRACGMIGRNGSGKSMLFRAICGFLRPDSGEVIVTGKRVGRDADYPEGVGFIIESPRFPSDLSGFVALELLARIRGRIGPKEAAQAMARVGLDPSDRRPTRKYSTGMRQRLGLAQALMEDPPILVLDEPLNGIDKQGMALVRELLLDEKRKGKTILMSSHIPGDIEEIADDMYEMDAGRLERL